MKEEIERILAELNSIKNRDVFEPIAWSKKSRDEYYKALEEEFRKSKTRKQKLYKYDNNNNSITETGMPTASTNKANENRRERRRNKRNSLRKGFRGYLPTVR